MTARAATSTNEVIDGVDSVMDQLRGIPLVGTHRFVATQCFRFGQWESPRILGSGRLSAPFLLHASCSWTIRTQDVILVSSDDPVPAAEADVSIEERLEWEQLHTDVTANRDLRLAAALSLDDEGDIKLEKKSEFTVEAVTFDLLGGIDLGFSNGISLFATISNQATDSWFLYCQDGRILSHYKGQLSLQTR